MSIYLFCEGQTEKNVVKKFTDLANSDFKGQGKAQVNQQMAKTLGPLLQKSAVRTLIMRDMDEGETPESIVQSVTEKVQAMLKEREFFVGVQLQSDSIYPNVYSLTLAEPDLRLVLHLATCKWEKNFVNATIDDYVLTLALRETTAESFLQKNQWEAIKPEQIIHKVTESIPALLQENGVPLREAKDYVRLYAAVIQAHTSPAIFAGKTLDNAGDEDKRDVFAPLLAALDFLGEEAT